MNTFLIVFLGAGIGGALRHGVNISTGQALRSRISLWHAYRQYVGSIVMDVTAGWFALKFDPAHTWGLFLTTGILGGFTTFSAFSLDTVVLIERGAHLAAGNTFYHLWAQSQLC